MNKKYLENFFEELNKFSVSLNNITAILKLMCEYDSEQKEDEAKVAVVSEEDESVISEKDEEAVVEADEKDEVVEAVASEKEDVAVAVEKDEEAVIEKQKSVDYDDIFDNFYTKNKLKPIINTDTTKTTNSFNSFNSSNSYTYKKWF